MISWIIIALIGFGGVIICILLLKKDREKEKKVEPKRELITEEAEGLCDAFNKAAETYEVPIMEIGKPVNPGSMKKVKRFANLVYKYN